MTLLRVIAFGTVVTGLGYAQAPPAPADSGLAKSPPAVANTPAPPAERDDAHRPHIQINTGVLSIDMILDLMNRDVAFDIEYTGAPARIRESGNEPKSRRPEENEQKQRPPQIADPLDTSAVAALMKARAPKAPADTGNYTKLDANYNRALSILNNAQKLFSTKKYALALKEINKSIETAPNIALAHAVRGSILYMLGDYDDARGAWERSLELDPSLDNVRAILYQMR